MRRALYFIFILPLFFCSIPAVFPQAQPIKVVPIGETIKPEVGTEPVKKTSVKKRRRSATTLVKAGESFIVELQTALSSGLNKEGETFYFRAVENVGPSSRPVIKLGAVGTGTIAQVEKNKKHGKLKLQFMDIQATNGANIPVSGGTELEGQGTQAALAVGDRFTATTDEKVVIKGKPKKEVETIFEKMGSVEIRGKGVDADIAKGTVKGKVQIILEPPPGVTIEDIDLASVVFYRVNSFEFPSPILVQTNKNTIGDRNKNGISDASLSINGWDFIRFQPRGKNIVYFMGNTKGGEPFGASTGVTIDY